MHERGPQGPFQTRITQLFGIRLPILAAGLQWISDASYVSAAVRAGTMGFITARSFASPEAVRDEIRRCRDLCGSDRFGVNLSMLPSPQPHERMEELVEVIATEGVPFVETAGRNPQLLLPLLRSAGVKLMHKVPTLRHALSAQKLGVDAVCLVGAEAGGHPSADLIGTMVQATLLARAIKIPTVIGGGIGTGEQIVAALALGVDGVAMGTRFLVAEEAWSHRDYKERLVAANETATALVMQSLNNTSRALANETTRTVADLEREGAGLADLMPHITGKLGRAAYASGDATRGLISLGQAVTFADRIEQFASITARLEEEMRASLARLDEQRVDRRAPTA
ncbi:NAD(P)H-dependent flavin oxidoreductase [Hydrogenophaga sp.]|uniref:NAD(P)H-dependent flavin oxidoreductase n=1 Tax=Hydrogenophaga sp. TaxID=1904254 RepID=UPI003F7108A6